MQEHSCQRAFGAQGLAAPAISRDSVGARADESVASMRRPASATTVRVLVMARTLTRFDGEANPSSD